MSVRSAFAALLLVTLCAACSAPVANSPREAEADGDGDGVPDRADRCPGEPEDYDGDRDGDGCPDVDASEQLLDVDDRCPIILDCEEGFIDDDGCPDVILVFEPSTTALTEQHRELLGELAAELTTRGKVRRLRIDGLSAAGETESLASQRAQAVRENLIARGVAPAMLEVHADRAPDGSSGFVSFFALECQ